MHFLDAKSALDLSRLFSDKLIHFQNSFQIIKLYTGYI